MLDIYLDQPKKLGLLSEAKEECKMSQMSKMCLREEMKRSKNVGPINSSKFNFASFWFDGPFRAFHFSPAVSLLHENNENIDEE